MLGVGYLGQSGSGLEVGSVHAYDQNILYACMKLLNKGCVKVTFRIVKYEENIMIPRLS